LEATVRTNYKAIADLQSIVTNEIPEGVALEYKRSAVLADRDVKAVCKGVTAFANSAGGQFIFGVESVEGKPRRLDGGVSGPSKRDWIFQIISVSTSPPVESFDVIELSGPSGSYYVIDVHVSDHAPHQSVDGRYYKRRGSHSEPMEDYEIQDVRNRPKRALNPLQLELVTRDQLAFLHAKNEHPSDALAKLRMVVSANFEFERDGIEELDRRGIRELRPGVERYFLLDAVPMMLSKNAEAQLDVEATYEFHDSPMTVRRTFFLGDLTHSAILPSPTVKAIQAVGDKIDRMTRQLERMAAQTEKLAHVVDGTGLRISQRTLSTLSHGEQRFSPAEFDWLGYKIILEISSEEAIQLEQVFGVIDTPAGRRARYEKLPAQLRQSFERRFRIEFD
jgi:hypothetical protein